MITKVLNLYAGLGGNRKLWKDVEVTSVEIEPRIAKVYSRLHPEDKLVIGDAHAFLAENYASFDYIWSSPPCQSHSKMSKFTCHKKKKYPDLSLYEEIIFLQHFCKGKWVVENVAPFYEPLIKPTRKVGRHVFWSNYAFEAMDIPRPKDFINLDNVQGKKAMMEWLGINFEEKLYYNNNHCPVQILRNCVHPLLGQQILQAANCLAEDQRKCASA